MAIFFCPRSCLWWWSTVGAERKCRRAGVERQMLSIDRPITSLALAKSSAEKSATIRRPSWVLASQRFAVIPSAAWKPKFDEIDLNRPNMDIKHTKNIRKLQNCLKFGGLTWFDVIGHPNFRAVAPPYSWRGCSGGPRRWPCPNSGAARPAWRKTCLARGWGRLFPPELPN